MKSHGGRSLDSRWRDQYHDSINTLYVNGHVLEQISGELPDTVGDNGIGLVAIVSGGVTHYGLA